MPLTPRSTMTAHCLFFACMSIGLFLGAYYAHPIMKLVALGIWMHLFLSLLKFRKAHRASQDYKRKADEL